MSWTDERIATLKKMWKEGKSAAEIAKTLGKGVTRNAVIGKAHRMGLSGRPSPIKKTPTTPKVKKAAVPKTSAKKSVAPKAPVKKESVVVETGTKKSARKSAAPAVVASKSKSDPNLREPPRLPVEEERPADGGVALLDLSERMCKWPFGDPQDDDFTFCGQPVRPGTPYCPAHAAAAYQTSSRSRTANAYVDKSAETEEDTDDVEADVDDDTDTAEEV